MAPTSQQYLIHCYTRSFKRNLSTSDMNHLKKSGCVCRPIELSKAPIHK
jgi:hypothetical protein